MHTRTRWLVGVGFVALFLATRLPNLMILPVFVDEALHLSLARVVSDTGQLIGSDSGKYLPIWLFAPLVRYAHDPLHAARLFSVGSGLLAALGLFLLGREIDDERAGLLAAVVYLAAPWTLFVDRMALVDSLLSALVVYALIVAIRWARSETGGWAIALGVVLGLAGLTKLYGLLLLVVPGALALLWPGPARSRLFRQLGAVYVLALAFLWPIALDLDTHLRYAVDRLKLLTPYGRGYPVLESIVTAGTESLKYLSPAGAALVLIGIAGTLMRRDPAERLLLGIGALWFLLFTAAGVRWLPRYLVPGCVPLLALGAKHFLRLSDAAHGLWHRAPRVIVASLLGVLVAGAWELDLALLTDPARARVPPEDRTEYMEGVAAGYGIAEVAAFLRERSAWGGLVVVRDARSGPLHEGLDLALEQEPAMLRFVETYYPEETDMPAADDLTAEPEAAYVLRQRPTSPLPPIDVEGRFRLVPVRAIPKPGGRWQMEIYRVERLDAARAAPGN